MNSSYRLALHQMHPKKCNEPGDENVAVMSVTQ